MRALYHISQELQAINDELIASGGEITDDLQNKLAITQTELAEKSANYGLVILSNEADSKAIDAEIKRLKAMKDSKDRAITRLKDAVREAMLVSNIDKIESPLFKLSLRRSESVEVDIVEALPGAFFNVKNVVTADKVAIKEAIKRGENVFGARIIENFNLQIK